jgi:hypothetical protein
VDAWLTGWAAFIFGCAEEEGDPEVSTAARRCVPLNAPADTPLPPHATQPQQLQELIAGELQDALASGAAPSTKKMLLNPADIELVKDVVVDLRRNDGRKQIATRSQTLLRRMLHRITEDPELREFIR